MIVISTIMIVFLHIIIIIININIIIIIIIIIVIIIIHYQYYSHYNSKVLKTTKIEDRKSNPDLSLLIILNT